jgi:hypothetical protein
LSCPAACKIGLLLNVSLLLFVAYCLSPYLTELKSTWQPFPVFCFLAFSPAVIAVLQGQDSILLLLMFALVFGNLKEGRELRAGSFLALPLLKFQFTLPILILFLVRRRWKFVLAFGVAVACLVLRSSFIAGPRGTLSYISFVWRLN